MEDGREDVTGLDETSAMDLLLGTDEPDPEDQEASPEASEDREDVPDEDVTAEDAEDDDAEQSDDEDEDEAEVDEDEEAEDEVDEDDEEAELFSVKIDGEELQLSKQELIDGYQVRSASDRRYKEAAQMRSEAGETLKQAQSLQTQYAQGLEAVETLIRQNAQGYTPEQMAKLAEEDPVEFTKQQGLQLQRQQQLQAVQQEQANLKALRLQQEEQRLPEVIPEWTDPEVRRKDTEAITGFIQKSGFNAAEVETLTSDARALGILRKAALFDQMQAQKPLAKKKVRKAPKMTKPGAPRPNQSRTDRRKKQLDRLAKTGSDDDALAALLADPE